jgi:MFS family permease
MGASTSPGSRRSLVPPALRVRPFRWYWAAQWPVLVGTWMQVVALGYFVFQLTHSQTAVGVVAAADGVPAVALSVAGGAIADRLPRRRVLLATQSVLGMGNACLAVLALSGRASLASIAAVAVVLGAGNAVDLPTRQALVADLVDRELVVSAVALGSVAMSACRILGPAIAGQLLVTAGPGVCFLALAVAYLVPITVLLAVVPDIPPVRSVPAASAGAAGPAAAVGALGAALRDPLVGSVLGCAAILALLGVSYMPYLPVFAATSLHGGGTELGLLYSTGGIGGLAAGLLIAGRGGAATRAPMLGGGGAVYAAGLFTLCHAHSLRVALPALVAISFGFLAMSTAMTTLLQTETDPALRGRLLGLYTTTMAGLQPLGTLAYGLAGRAVPLFDAIGVGALVVGAAAVWTSTRPAIRRTGRARRAPAAAPLRPVGGWVGRRGTGGAGGPPPLAVPATMPGACPPCAAASSSPSRSSSPPSPPRSSPPRRSSAAAAPPRRADRSPWSAASPCPPPSSTSGSTPPWPRSGSRGDPSRGSPPTPPSSPG